MQGRENAGPKNTGPENEGPNVRTVHPLYIEKLTKFGLLVSEICSRTDMLMACRHAINSQVIYMFLLVV